VAQVKLKVMGLPERAGFLEETALNAKNIWEIIQHIESRYPFDYYTFAILLNGVHVDDKSKNLHDGDEVVIVPIMSGG
jgi:molybdopterin converting factor small subunit